MTPDTVAVTFVVCPWIERAGGFSARAVLYEDALAKVLARSNEAAVRKDFDITKCVARGFKE